LVPTGLAKPIQIGPGEAGRLIVLLPYTPERVEKIKAVAGRRWHPDGRYWTVPHTEQALAHLLALLAGEPVEVDASLRRAAVPDDRPKVSRGAAPAPGLVDELRRAIAARHYRRSTEQAYVAWVRRFVSFHGGRHPAQMDEGDINRFLTHLATGERVAASTQNQALAALLFLYDKVLHRPLGQIEGVVRARRPRRLPVVLTREEVRAVLNELDGTPHLVCSLLYGSGLRLLECLRVGVKDIDLHRGEITVRDGKGGKDRVTVLPAAVRAPLTERQWLPQSRNPFKPCGIHVGASLKIRAKEWQLREMARKGRKPTSRETTSAV
jgi:site-specific recombinase XerC